MEAHLRAHQMPDTRSDSSGPVQRPRIRLAIVDDHPMMCQGLAATFGTHGAFEVIGVGQTADAAVALATELLPDVMLIDITLPGDGLSAVQTISWRFPAVKIVVLTMHQDAHYIRKAFLAGASGFLNKGITSTELIEATRSIAFGDYVMPPTVAAGLIGHREEGGKATGVEAMKLDLTERELEILLSLSGGKTNKEIAAAMGLAEKTIKNYLTNIMRKLHVRSRVEAALIAAKLNRGPDDAS